MGRCVKSHYFTSGRRVKGLLNFRRLPLFWLLVVYNVHCLSPLTSQLSFLSFPPTYHELPLLSSRLCQAAAQSFLTIRSLLSPCFVQPTLLNHTTV